MKLLATVTILLFVTFPSLSISCEHKVWQGGLWNLDLAFDISTYGYFSFCIEKDAIISQNTILKIRWIEKHQNSSERIYAFRLFDELELEFHVDKSLKIEMGDTPSEYHLSNNQGQKLKIRLWEPARYEIIKRK